MNKHYFFNILLFGTLILTPVQGSAQDQHGHDEHGHDEHGEENQKIHVSPEMQKTIGLTLETARPRALEQKVQVYGEIAQDTDRYTHITADHEGEVRKIHAPVGSVVDTGHPLISVAVEDGGIKTFNAPHHGTVIAVHVRPGDRIDQLRSLASLVDLDTLRVSFDVYEKDLRYVSIGQPVNVRSTAYPDQTFPGKIVFISPRVDKHTQTIRIRADVENTDHLLRLGMFVTGDLIYSTGGKALSVSRAAVQQIEGEDVVFIPEDDEFEAREVRTGREFGKYIEITDGLQEGAEVVAGGSFALKSELQKGSFGDGHNH